MKRNETNDRTNESRMNDMEKRNNDTELVFIIDRSGSMEGLEADTIGGFNSMIKKQKQMKAEGRVYVSTVFFSDESDVFHDRENLTDVELMTEKDYQVGGCTALLDAIGDAVHHISNVHKYARPEDVPAHTLFMITTDGMENASRRYSASDIRTMIKCKEKEAEWEFLFVAANIDAVETAEHIGIRRERAANYRHDKAGTRSVYDAVAKVACSMRNCKAVEEDWACEIVAPDAAKPKKS